MQDQAAFDELLRKRNLDADALRERLPHIYEAWLAIFKQSHAESFLAQVRYQINAVRRALMGLEPSKTSVDPPIR